MEALLDGTGPDTGHTWVEGHRSRDNLCVRCSTCGFFVEQVDSKVSFAKKKCVTLVSGGNHRLPLWGNTSPTKMVNGGKMWLCCRCGLRQWVGMEQLASGLAKPCRQVYTGKDQWIVACIKKFAPKKEGFFQPQGFLRKDPKQEALGSPGGLYQAQIPSGDGYGDETMMGGAAPSGVRKASNQNTRKEPQNPEVGQVQRTPNHPTWNQGEFVVSSKKPEAGEKSAGDESSLEPAATDPQISPQVHTSPKKQSQSKPKGKAKATSKEKGRQTKLQF